MYVWFAFWIFFGSLHDRHVAAYAIVGHDSVAVLVSFVCPCRVLFASEGSFCDFLFVPSVQHLQSW